MDTITPLFQAFQTAVTADNTEQAVYQAKLSELNQAQTQASVTLQTRKDAVAAFKAAVSDLDELGNEATSTPDPTPVVSTSTTSITQNPTK